MGLVDGVVDWGVKTGVRWFARLWHNDGYLGRPLAAPVRGADPIVLVNGFTVYNEVLEPAVRSLRRDGFTVFVPELPNNAMGSIEETARFLRNYVEQVRRRTGARKVDVVGFSEGGLIARSYIKHHGGDKVVDAAISVATPHNGVLHPALSRVIEGVGLLRWLVPEAARDMLRGSPYMRAVNAGDPTPGPVRWTSLYSKDFDGIVWPGDSPVLDGARNIAMAEDSWFPGLQGPHHLGLQQSHAGYELLRATLLS